VLLMVVVDVDVDKLLREGPKGQVRSLMIDDHFWITFDEKDESRRENQQNRRGRGQSEW